MHARKKVTHASDARRCGDRATNRDVTLLRERMLEVKKARSSLERKHKKVVLAGLRKIARMLA